MNEKKLLGRWGESLAAEYLRRKRYNIIGMGYTTRFGEIDIIAENKRLIVFVEVKLRRDRTYHEAREYVTPAKQRRVMAAAREWLSDNETDKELRFDVIEVYAPEGFETKKPEIIHLEGAFWET